ncbi:hypothetical protein P3T76_009041 [Phytophthora citrophthora]|uniref:BED-type domain-containing protein n=1 Tax=Phytophthora citrophthora TaxID=4793 RepID=A0AAD9GI77_9STRA|nr:hypothetical protein P3T76_009041 [Phytophthora citrophthora]
MVSNKQLAEYFFVLEAPGFFKCRYCSKIRKQAFSNGFTNLISHLTDKHPQHERGGSKALDTFGFVTDYACTFYHWIRWVVERNVALEEVDNKLTRKMSRWASVSSQTLKKYMALMERKVETAISQEMPDSIGITFDGWHSGSTYYVGVYAIYVVDDSPRRVLLALAPLLAENDFGADSHIEFIVATLAVFDKQPGCVRFIVGDNCITNQAIATRMGLPLVVCASHRLNLATQQHVSTHKNLLAQVNELMCQLRTKKNAATLSKCTEVRLVKRNVNRWSSTFKMVKRFLQIKDAIKHVEALEELVPRDRDCRKLEKLWEDLQALDSVCLTLQSNKTTRADVRVLFDGVVKRYPETANYLAYDATIVRSPSFGTAVVKVTCGEGALTCTEAAAIAPFRIREGDTLETSQENDVATFAATLLHAGRKRSHAAANTASYEPLLLHVPPTSNDCERLFSKAKAVLTPQRSSMLPINFEMIMLLKEIGSYWSRCTVAEVQQSSSDYSGVEEFSELTQASLCQPTEEDWFMIQLLLELLVPFGALVEELWTSKHPSLLFALPVQGQEFEPRVRDTMLYVRESFEKLLEERFGNLSTEMWWTSLLNPRFSGTELLRADEERVAEERQYSLDLPHWRGTGWDVLQCRYLRNKHFLQD